MDRRQIIENNVLIAKFMGAVSKNDPHIGLWLVRIKNNVKPYPILQTKLKYHKDWNWLIPVVEYIESKGYEFWIKMDACIIYQYPDTVLVNTMDAGTKQWAVWLSVLEFIKWYNKQPKHKK